MARDANITPLVLSEQSFGGLPEMKDTMFGELRNVLTHRDGTADRTLSPKYNQRNYTNSKSPLELRK